VFLKENGADSVAHHGMTANLSTNTVND